MSLETTPQIGSYDPDDVTILLTELPAVDLELPTEERERLMQGGGHYAETLPIEYEPTVEYEQLFERLLQEGAARVAELTAVVAQRLLDEHHPEPVLVSLARAGTPVGVLLRRALAMHGVDAPHFSISIVRGRGIDTVALDHILARHAPERLVFVDGWTGKGAILGVLQEAVVDYAHQGGPALQPTLAVLADTGHVTELAGSRQDELIPSACLNSTVSGLISRTVVRPDLLGPGAFHGVRVYREFAPRDVSRRYVDTITQHLPAPGSDQLADAVARAHREPPPDGRGLPAVLAVGERYGIADVNRVKPGIGETTRVLLRRIPRAVLVDPAQGDKLEHVLQLARERDVEVIEHSDGVYACYGLIDEVGGS